MTLEAILEDPAFAEEVDVRTFHSVLGRLLDRELVNNPKLALRALTILKDEFGTTDSSPIANQLLATIAAQYPNEPDLAEDYELRNSEALAVLRQIASEAE